MTEVEENANMSKDMEEDTKEESIYEDENAAVIVSFLEQFGSFIFADKTVVMSDLMDWLSTRDEVSPELVDFHVKLLRKLKRSVNPEKWERAIIKFCYSYGGSNDSFEVERYGYLYSSTTVKLRIVKNLLESQFDVNVKFKNAINQKPAPGLRLEPFGRDKDGNVYYCQMDEKANIKIYQENLDEETWSVVAGNREELVKLIDELKGNRPIRPFPKDLIDEDSSSNSRPCEKDEVKIEDPPQLQIDDVETQPASDEQPQSEPEPKEETEIAEKITPAQKKRRRK